MPDFDIKEEDGCLPYLEALPYEVESTYRPLVDTPYLFLEFARIRGSRRDPVEELLIWISKYGLLGLSSQNPQWSAEPLPDAREWIPGIDWLPEVTVTPMRYSDAGGPGDIFDAYLHETAKANKLLSLYEALLSQGIGDLERCFAMHEGCTPKDLREKWDSDLSDMRKSNSTLNESTFIVQEIVDDMLVYKALPSDWNTYLMNRALLEIWATVGTALSLFAYPSITLQEGSGPITGAPKPDDLTNTWRPRNLLRTIYLQFYWLITSTGDLSHCKYCGRIISYAPPMPESRKRKPRKDKEFCDSRCRQNYHYHNRIKSTHDPA